MAQTLLEPSIQLVYKRHTLLRDQALSLISSVQYRTVASRTQTDKLLKRSLNGQLAISLFSYLIADLSRMQEKATLLEERTTCIDNGYLTMTGDII
jgi:hypothetical protein